MEEYFVDYGFDLNSTFVAFYGDKGQDLFGNFWECPFCIKYTYKGTTFENNNVEACFQGAKFSFDPNVAKKFNKISGIGAFKLSKHYSRMLDWDNVKFQVMKDVLRIKFSCDEYKRVLLATGDRYLVEHNKKVGRDLIWSDNADGSGKNNLGKLLMEIRGEYGGTGIVQKPIEYEQWIQSLCSKCYKYKANPGKKWCQVCWSGGH